MQNWSTVYDNDPIWKKLRTGEIEDVIFDSGGFQMITGVKTYRVVNREHYALWLKLTLRDYPMIRYFNLDIIGDQEQTMDNLRFLESKGLHPIPVWQATRADIYDVYLDYYCSKYKYVAIGGIAGATSNSIFRLAQFLLQRYPDNDFHLLGVGLSVSRVCKIYRPYSADASSWLAPARWGSELIFDGQNIKLIDMSPEDKLAIRKNDDIRTDWSRKTIQRIKEFEALMNSTKPTGPIQIDMFASDELFPGIKYEDGRSI